LFSNVNENNYGEYDEKLAVNFILKQTVAHLNNFY